MSKIIHIKHIPCIQICVSSIYNGKEYFTNSEFKTATGAANHWALNKAHDWFTKRPPAAYDGEYFKNKKKLQKKFARRAKPIFERMLKE